MFKRKKTEEIVIANSGMSELGVQLDKLIDGQSQIEVGNYSSEYVDLINKINQLVEMDENTGDEIVNSMTGILDEVTKMTVVKAMVQHVHRQTDIVEGVAASSQEMAATIEDVSTFVQESSSHATDAINQTNHNVEVIKLALGDSVKATQGFEEIKHQIAEVHKEMQSITEMVTIIKGIADQTNLLALNASIEAARAGESGRGFAVVADEIKKLADTTKESVGFIEDVTNNLEQSMNKTVEQIDVSDRQFSASNSRLSEAVDSLSGITDSVDQVCQNMMQISANVEEQTAASEEVASSMMELLEGSRELQVECDTTGKGLYDLSVHIDQARIEAWNKLRIHKPISAIEICVTDHLIWTWRVYNMLLGYSNIDPSSVGDHRSCRLGKWLATLKTDDPKVVTILNRMEGPHSALHVCAKDAAIAYNKGHIETAEDKLDEMGRHSDVVVACLDELKRVLK